MQTLYPIFYSFRRCPYAMRARLAIVVSNCVCELREVVLRDKPPEMLVVSPKGTVPVLIDINGRVIDESIDIMLWALAQQDPEKWLMPESGDLAAMRELIGECDADGGRSHRDFKYNLDRYKYPNRYEGTDGIFHRNEGYLYLERLNQQLSKTRYLFGNSVALADMAIAPFVRQFAHTDLLWFNQQPLSHLQAWLAWFVDSEIYNRIMNKYPQWKSGTEGVIFPQPNSVLSNNLHQMF